MNEDLNSAIVLSYVSATNGVDLYIYHERILREVTIHERMCFMKWSFNRDFTFDHNYQLVL